MIYRILYKWSRLAIAAGFGIYFLDQDFGLKTLLLGLGSLMAANELKDELDSLSDSIEVNVRWALRKLKIRK